MKRARSLWFVSWILATLGVLVTFLAFGEALDNGFVSWDDPVYVTKNYYIQPLSFDRVRWMFTQAYAANWHPLTWFSHALDIHFFGLDPWGHHLTSVLLHCANVVGVFGVSVLLLRSISIRPTERLIAAALTSLFFGIHPTHVESVAWIAERKDVLCLFFVLLTLIAHLSYTYAPRGRKSVVLYALSLFAFSAALLSKPMAVTLPIVLLLIDIYPLRRLPGANGRIPSARVVWGARRLLLEKIPFFALSAISVVLTLWAQSGGGALSPMSLLPPTVRVYNAASALIFYQLKWLVPTDLSPFYPLFPLPGVHLNKTLIIPFGLLFAQAMLSIWRWRRGDSLWLASLLFYTVTLFPVLGIIQVGSQGAADRYSYLPTLPFFLVLGVGLARLIMRRRPISVHIASALAIVMCVGILVGATRAQVRIWKDDVSLWTKSARLYPDDQGIQINYGDALVGAKRHEDALEVFQAAVTRGNPERTIRGYQASGLLSPYGRLHQRISTTLVTLGRYREAIQQHEYVLMREIQLEISRSETYSNLAWLHVQMGEKELAILACMDALKEDPNNRTASALLSQLSAGLPLGVP